MSVRKEQFSIDFLAKGGGSSRVNSRSSASSPDLGEAAMSDALAVYSAPILRTLKTVPNHEMYAQDLIRNLQDDLGAPPYEQFLAVLERLAALGRITYRRRDELSGNHLIALQDPG